MAFDGNNFKIISPVSRDYEGGQIFSYTTSDDNMSTVITSGYFDDVARDVSSGDLILVNAADTFSIIKFTSDGGTMTTEDFTATADGDSVLAPSGTMTLGGTGNTNNNDLRLNFESSADDIFITSTTGVDVLVFQQMAMRMQATRDNWEEAIECQLTVGDGDKTSQQQGIAVKVISNDTGSTVGSLYGIHVNNWRNSAGNSYDPGRKEMHSVRKQISAELRQIGRAHV